MITYTTNDITLNTNYPFRWGCSLALTGGFPLRYLVSMQIHTHQHSQIPYRISLMSVAGDYITWTIVDSNNTTRASVSFSTANTSADDSDVLVAWVKDLEGCIAGKVCYTREFVQAMLGSLKVCGGLFHTQGADFVFDASVHLPIPDGVFKSVVFNGYNSTTDVIMKTPTNTTETTKGSVIIQKSNPASSTVEEITVSVVPSYPETTVGDFTTLKIGSTEYGLKGAGKDVIIRASLASNLRVVTKDKTVQLKGVLDA